LTKASPLIPENTGDSVRDSVVIRFASVRLPIRHRVFLPRGNYDVLTESGFLLIVANPGTRALLKPVLLLI